MSIVSHFLLASGDLAPYKNVIQDVLDSTVKAVESHIPLPSVDVIFYQSPKAAIAGYGVGGRTLNSHEIFIAVDVQTKDFPTLVHDRMMRSLCHEFHHAARLIQTGPWTSVGENIVSEGLAQVFAEEMDHQPPAPWSVALSSQVLEAYLRQARNMFHDETYDHFAWFYGSQPTEIPKWTGYSVGYAFVKNYLQKHPRETAATLYAADATLFV